MRNIDRFSPRLGVQLRIALQVGIQRCRQCDRHLDSVRRRQRPEPQLRAHGAVEKQWLIGSQHQVPAHYHPHREARANGQRGLHVKTAPGELLADLIDTVLQALLRGDNDPVLVVAAIRRGKLRADADKVGKGGSGEKLRPVPVDVVPRDLPSRRGRRRAADLSPRRMHPAR